MSERSLLIAGPGTGFTIETATRFADEGFTIGLMGRNEQSLNKLAACLSADNIEAHLFMADFTDEESVDRAMKQCADRMPHIESLIYNVKQSHHGDIFSASIEEVQSDLDANVLGLLRVVRSVIKSWPRTKNASVLLAGGGYKDYPDPDKLSLAVSKGAFHSLGLSMKQPLAEQDITISELVINGFVGDAGNISPTDVANTFWGLHDAHISQVIEIPKPS